MFYTIAYKDNIVTMIDQTRLPGEELYLDFTTYKEVSKAIKDMIIRGAPAIGVAAALGVALGAKDIQSDDYETFYAELEEICYYIGRSRPTAVNLFWALERMKKVARSNSTMTGGQLKECLEQEAVRIMEEDVEINKGIGSHGHKVIADGDTVLTHCNAGALATAGYGTALGVIRAAINAGKKIEVLADETRPFLQGTRLTAWELQKDNIPVKIITDNMAGYFMRKGMINVVVVGADRIAANGDVANKIGTYSVAVLAKENNIPFYVAAPVSTLDLTLPTGEEIPIEERPQEEVTHLNGIKVAPEGVSVYNPAFDITPNKYVSGIITEKGIATAPFDKNLREFMAT